MYIAAKTVPKLDLSSHVDFAHFPFSFALQSNIAVSTSRKTVSF
jgi:hypothetical protein